ncbi:MAG: M50 family peptidase [Pedobacter sp.]|nr:MAG: M50 family peptidase [Pedobacter sp.]
MSEKRKSQFTKYIALAVFTVVCAVGGYFIGKMGSSLAIPKASIMLATVLFIPAFFIVIAVHEAGHAITGVLVGFDFRTFIVGPFLWDKEGAKWKFKWNTNINTAGGMVLCLPKGKESISKKFALFAAGGPLASIALTVVTAGIAYFIHINEMGSSATKAILLLLSGLSALIFLTTIVPYRAGGLASDGARIIKMLSGGEGAKFEILILTIIASTSSGVRPKLLDIETLTEAQVLGEKINAPFKIYLPGIFHQRAFDEGDLDAAEVHLTNHIAVVDEMPKGFNGVVWLDAAFFHAYARKNLDKAIEYWEKFVPSAMIPKAQIYATEAAIAQLKNDYALASSKIEDAKKELPNMIDRGVAVALEEKLDSLKRRTVIES